MKFLRWITAACASALVASSASAQTSDEAISPVGVAPSIVDFVDGPTLSSASLSPSGRYLVWVLRAGDNSLVQVRDLETGAENLMHAGSANENFGGIYVNWIRWKTDDRLLIGLTRLELRRSGNRETGSVRGFAFGSSVLSVGRDGSGMIALQAPTADDGQPGDLLDILQDDPDHVLMTYRPYTGGLNVARVNILTGAAVKTIDGNRRVLDYITDSTGAVVGRTALRGLGAKVLVMEARSADGEWTEVFRLRRDQVRDLPDYDFLGGTAEPNRIYVAVHPSATEGENTAGVHIFDFATRTMGPAIWRNAQYDVTGVVVDADTYELKAGCYWADIYRCDFIDRGQDAVMAGIRRYFGDAWSVNVVSQARDGGRWLVHASAPNNPGEYHIFNVAERRMDFLGALYPRLPEASLGSMRRVDYVADDGQALFGYLTRPPGAAPDAVLPLVVMPHGGPELRDYMTYDQWAQFLATRGYQVFQPNFRGSAGMGKGFAEAGYRQWGRLMQDDVTDGVEHLIARGLADPERVCIMGASYGGYAALQSGASRPDLYRCVIAVSGPSDLAGMLRWERSEAGADSDQYEYWVRSIGDPGRDRAAIEAASPIRQAPNWRPPVLLIHGDRDDVVPVAQARDMERALRRAGKDVRMIILEDQGHGDWSTAAQIRALTEIETFLARNLPVTPPR